MEEKTKESEKTLTQDQSPAEKEAQVLIELKKQNDALLAQNAELQAAKTKYYDAVLNGQSEPTGVQSRTPKEIREEIAKKSADNTNLENAKLYLELNEAVKARGGQSIFLPVGKNVQITYDEAEGARKLEEALKLCVEAANGDPDRFNSELKSHMKK